MKLQRVLPILEWGRTYNGSTLSADLLAAVIVTIMLIPQSLAYAMLAGLPPQVGLYASILPIIAYALFGGYIWLGTGGLLWLVYGGVPAGPLYDAVLHSVFLGFVFAMIFGHAPLIFPSVLQRPMAYLPSFYLPLIFLHLSLVMRITGDLINNIPLRQWGSLLNGLTLLLFLLITATALAQGSKNQAPDAAPPKAPA